LRFTLALILLQGPVSSVNNTTGEKNH